MKKVKSLKQDLKDIGTVNPVDNFLPKPKDDAYKVKLKKEKDLWD